MVQILASSTKITVLRTLIIILSSLLRFESIMAGFLPCKSLNSIKATKLPHQILLTDYAKDVSPHTSLKRQYDVHFISKLRGGKLETDQALGQESNKLETSKKIDGFHSDKTLLTSDFSIADLPDEEPSKIPDDLSLWTNEDGEVWVGTLDNLRSGVHHIMDIETPARRNHTLNISVVEDVMMTSNLQK